MNRGGELKYVDLASASYAFDTTGSITLLNGIAVGDDNNTRDGRQIFNKSIQVMGSIKPALTNPTGVPSFCRLLLVWDSQSNSAALPTFNNLLTATTSTGMLNLDNRERFTVLRDLKYTIGNVSVTATQSFAEAPSTATVNIFVDLKGVKTTYSGVAATIGNIMTGSLLMFTIGDQAAGSGATFVGSTRLRFYDS